MIKRYLARPRDISTWAAIAKGRDSICSGSCTVYVPSLAKPSYHIFNTIPGASSRPPRIMTRTLQSVNDTCQKIYYKIVEERRDNAMERKVNSGRGICFTLKMTDHVYEP